ncbi:hypothetical protein NM208_g2692 [Fusarium decemcellulare]|uniref:Uncharacterized protein n=1 Tax=Fusarium decemcellulare TaxID=57161 RepID=A0ACC1SRR7_9HYPO|nr:hypothetical protein NM208_g2692 [Fusarium decemcellulare]
MFFASRAEEQKQKMSDLLTGTALVTGAGAGIGRATSIAFVQHGIRKLALLDVDDAGLDRTAYSISQLQLGEVQILKVNVDVGNDKSLVQAIQKVVDELGRIDIAVNNAGIGGPIVNSTDLSVEDYRKVIDINMVGLWVSQREEIKHMLKQDPVLTRPGGVNRGVIVNMSSIFGLIGPSASTPASAYSTSKHGVVAITKNDANSFAKDGIRINAICPGYVDTRNLAAVVTESDVMREELRKVPMGRLGSVSEIAENFALIIMVPKSLTDITASIERVRTSRWLRPKVLHYAFASCGLICGTLFFIAFLASDFLVPLSPSWSAERTAEHYRKHQAGIHAGSALMMFSGTFFLPYTIAISDQMRRIPNIPWVLPQIQIASGIAGTFGFFMPGMHLAVAALRVDRSPELIELANDTFWMYAILPFQTFILQSWAWSYAIIIDNRPNPMYPKILAVINLVVPAMFMFSVAVHATLRGPFAWNGALGFWLPLITFGLQFIADAYFLFRAIHRDHLEVEHIGAYEAEPTERLEKMAPGASELVIAEWTIISLTTAVIAARIYLRLGIQKRRLLGSDLWMTAAWAMGIVVAAFCITFIRMGVMEQGIDPSLKAYDGSKEEKQYIRKLLWISTLPFLTSFYICKSALLCVYLQVIPAFMTSRRMFLWATIGFVGVSYLITIILFFTTCTPISRFWTLDPNRQCLLSSWMIFVRTSWALNFAGDVFIFALPWLIVPDLMVKGWLRVGIYFTFLLGLINMVISIVRFVKLYGGNEGEISLVTIHFWNSLDLYIGLVIACLPSLRPYFNLATESRAFNYVKGKTTSRLSGHTATASTQSSEAMSLIIRNDHTDTYAMHPIVHRWARERPKMRLAEQALWAEVTGRVLAASVLLPPLGTAAADEKYHISLLSHVMHVQDCRRSTAEAISNARSSTNQVFSWIISLVPDLAPDADKVRMYAKFSLIYAKCGYWKEAEELLKEGQYTVARDLQEEVLRELLLRLPHDSADVLEAKNNLGLTILKFWKRHHFEQAVRLHSEAAEGMAKVHGPDHEQTLAAKEHLCRAAVLLGGDHLESVEDLMTEVLETRRAKLGKEHPYTLLAMVNMAIVLTAMGQYKKAEDLVLEGLPVAGRTLGRDHIGTLFGRQTHAAILLERREYAAAEEILLQVAESQKHMASHRGDYHPDRLGALIELARCSFALSKIDRAAAICDEAIYGLDSISMEEHPLAISLRVSRSRMLELTQSSLIDHRPEQHSHAIFPFIFFQPRNDTTDF